MTRFRASVRIQLGRVRQMRRLPLVPLATIGVLVAAGVFADAIAPHDPLSGSLRDSLTPPSWVTGGNPSFLLGTDKLGRDVLSRVIFGARVSLLIVLASLFVSATIGVLVGALAGHFGSWIDEVAMRIVDTQLSLPGVLIVLALVLVFGSSLELLIGIIGFWLWPTYARLVRGEVLRTKTLDYIALARIAGASTWRILFVHELPAVTNTVVVVATLQAGSVILLEGSLSFLGVGVPPPQPSWGSMIADGRALISSAWWISLFPGVVMSATVLSLNLLGDWLRDALDPKRVVV